MFEFIKKVLQQVFEFFNHLSPARKAASIALLIVTIGGVAITFRWAGQKSYRPLMSNLNPEDASNVMKLLRDKRIPFRVDPSGKNIEVPPESLHELRLELAMQGMPQSSIVGYELFDKQQFGVTSYVQKVNQRRALEGELMRTINTIKGVKRSRIHLTLPEKSAFVEDQKKASASVVLDLEPATVLSEKQIYGIGTMVAKAIEGMDTADVVVVDANGKMLSKNNRDPLMAMTANQLDYQHKVEEELEKRVEEMLSRVVGEGKVVARVTADIDFNKQEETATSYDADGSAVRSAVKVTDSAEGVRPGPAGPPGATSNLPGAPGQTQANAIRNSNQKNNETTNYEIPQTIKRTAKAMGQIQKLSVAILMDGKTTKTTDKDGKVETKVEPYPAEKLAEFDSLVSKALGIDKKRGDTLEIKSMEFSRVDFDEANQVIQQAEQRGYIQNLVVYLVIGLIITFFFLFVVRPFIKWVTENTIDSVDTFLPQTIEELERMQKNAQLPGLEDAMPILNDKIAPEKVEGEMIKEKIVTLIETHPSKAALILKDWIKGNVVDSHAKAGAEDPKAAAPAAGAAPAGKAG